MIRSTCPPPGDLLRMLDGEATRNEELDLRAHLDGCAACQEQTANLRQLLGDIAAPLENVASAASVDKVLFAVRAGRVVPAPVRRRPATLWTAGFSMAAAVALVVLAGRGLRTPSTRDDFRARGGAAETALGRRTGINLYAPITKRKLLGNGSAVSAKTAFTATYRNLEQRPIYLLLFGVDAAGEVHWLYPAFTDRNSDPPALRLPFGASETALPESVVLDEPALGKMRIVSIVAPRPLRVSALESLSRDQLERAALARRWMDSQVEDFTITLFAPQKGAIQ